MCMASAVREGGRVNINTLGIPESLVRDAFQYLQDCGFIAMYEAQYENYGSNEICSNSTTWEKAN